MYVKIYIHKYSYLYDHVCVCSKSFYDTYVEYTVIIKGL